MTSSFRWMGGGWSKSRPLATAAIACYDAAPMIARSLFVLLAVGAPAAAQPTDEPALRSQIQADLGLAVVGLGYERPVAAHVAVQLEAQIFGTYFLPWFDAGDDVQGLGFETRVTW